MDLNRKTKAHACECPASLQYVTTRFPERRLFIRYVDMLQISVPFVWACIDNTLQHRNAGSAHDRIILEASRDLALCFFIYPLLLTFLIRVMWYFPQNPVEISPPKRWLLSCCLWGPLGFLSFFLLWTTVNTEIYADGKRWLVFLVIGGYAMLSCYVFADYTISSTRSFSLQKTMSTMKASSSEKVLWLGRKLSPAASERE
eukprot:TRINITY_DN13503_c1_g1_i4.p1 TRINITY_DN13503_c1_g1~~TRINITY_DN13503_c1_g1_i4.p1  ORF type:complete len:201 (+),score=11.97 TRINITY_DN13503_c1_g1_i4:98-700(+)